MSKLHIEPLLEVPSLKSDIVLSELLNVDPPAQTQLRFLWDGKHAPKDLNTDLWVAWTPSFLYCHFSCSFASLNVSGNPQSANKTMGLWDRDVVEIFIAPDTVNRYLYREIEVSPAGEWLDVELQMENGERHSNWDWRSGVESASVIEDELKGGANGRVWKTAFRIPTETLFGGILKSGQECLGNFFRCDGSEPDRNYLAWSPTMTEQPNFHVPERFGRIRFIDKP